MRRVKTAVLISGQGSNLKALIDAARASAFPASIALVISNRADAYGIVVATDAMIPARVIAHTDFETRAAFEEALDAALVAQSEADIQKLTDKRIAEIDQLVAAKEQEILAV